MSLQLSDLISGDDIEDPLVQHFVYAAELLFFFLEVTHQASVVVVLTVLQDVAPEEKQEIQLKIVLSAIWKNAQQ